MANIQALVGTKVSERYYSRFAAFSVARVGEAWLVISRRGIVLSAFHNPREAFAERNRQALLSEGGGFSPCRVCGCMSGYCLCRLEEEEVRPKPRSRRFVRVPFQDWSDAGEQVPV